LESKVEKLSDALKALGVFLFQKVNERKVVLRQFKERLEIAVLEIKVHGNDIERALKNLKRELQKESLFKEIKQRSYYEKPSEKEKRKQREARKKRRKSLRFNKPVRAVKK
jgi:small subunit ribosomal protein S21